MMYRSPQPVPSQFVDSFLPNVPLPIDEVKKVALDLKLEAQRVENLLDYMTSFYSIASKEVLEVAVYLQKIKATQFEISKII